MLMVTSKQAWIGFVVLLLVVLFVVLAMMYWQHTIHVNYLHLLALGLDPPIGHGC
jgi:hypothetical protein